MCTHLDKLFPYKRKLITKLKKDAEFFLIYFHVTGLTQLSQVKSPTKCTVFLTLILSYPDMFRHVGVRQNKCKKYNAFCWWFYLWYKRMHGENKVKITQLYFGKYYMCHNDSWHGSGHLNEHWKKYDTPSTSCLRDACWGWSKSSKHKEAVNGFNKTRYKHYI
jgi:hypothetical protein